MPDAALLERIQGVLSDSPVHGEVHRKVWARLRIAGVRTSLRRVLRLMREGNLLAPGRVGQPRGPRNHDGTIIPDAIDTMWGTDVTATWTAEGQVAVFIAVDHYNPECIGIHAARRGTRFEALEPLHQGVRRHFGAIGKEIAHGLAVRHDHGSQYMSDTFQTEMRFLVSTAHPPSSVPRRATAVRSVSSGRKEDLLSIRTFDTVEELRLALFTFRDIYNTTWLIQRLDYRTRAQLRQEKLSALAIAA
jgi:putative transposase